VKRTNSAKLNASGKRSRGIKLFVLTLRFHAYIVRRKSLELILLIMKIMNVKALIFAISVV